MQVSISLSSGFSFQVPNGTQNNPEPIEFQSRYRAASHFRGIRFCLTVSVYPGFNLVIERLLISCRNSTRNAIVDIFVSISLSSGFSFQVVYEHGEWHLCIPVSISLSSGFSFQVISRSDYVTRTISVSISLSSGFSFQENCRKGKLEIVCVSISLSSGFSFQVASARFRRALCCVCFNLVIERLLISGQIPPCIMHDIFGVSISLSSGFSFQEKNASYDKLLR